jgi:hypothetical protein
MIVKIPAGLIILETAWLYFISAEGLAGSLIAYEIFFY